MTLKRLFEIILRDLEVILKILKLILMFSKKKSKLLLLKSLNADFENKKIVDLKFGF